jgi:hypothetical protein
MGFALRPDPKRRVPMQPADDGPGKPVHIHRAIGRRPIMAAGNSSGGAYMLKYATGRSGAALGLLAHHDDAERAYAYDGGAGEALRQAGTESGSSSA